MYSQTFGNVSVDEMIDKINDYISADKQSDYEIVIGTDSQNYNLTKVVVVVAIHRVGSGGIFFYDVKRVNKIKDLRQKIYYETALSLELASKLSLSFAEKDIKQDITIHADVGKKGKTSMLIPEIVGWITSSGYKCRIKPESWAASCVADKISK